MVNFHFPDGFIYELQQGHTLQYSHLIIIKMVKYNLLLVLKDKILLFLIPLF
jgi:hypothetical protein